MAQSVDFMYVATLDADGVEKALNKIDAQATKLSTKLDKSFKTIETAGIKSFNGIANAAKTALTEVNKSVAETQETIKNLGGEVSIGTGTATETPITPPEPIQIADPDSIAQANALSQAIAKMHADISAFTAAELQLVGTSDRATEAFIRQAQAVSKDSEVFLDAVKTAGLLETEESQLAVAIGKTKAVLNQQLIALNKLEKGTKPYTKQLDKVADTYKKLGVQTDKAGNKFNEYFNAQVQASKGVDKGTKAVIAQASAVTKDENKIRELAEATGLLETKEGRLAVSIAKARVELDRQRDIFSKTSRGSAEYGRSLQGLVGAEKNLNGLLAQQTQIAGGGKLSGIFKGLTQGLGASTLAAGGLAGVVAALTLGLIKLASTIVKSVGSALKSIAKVATETGTQFNLAGKAITNAIGARGIQLSADQSIAVFERIREVSKATGQDAVKLANSFIPLIDNLGQLEELADVSLGLQQIGIVGGRPINSSEVTRILTEASTGQFKPLKDILEVNPAEIAEIKRIAEEAGGGVAGLTKGFTEALFKFRGINIEELKNTIPVQTEILKESLKGITGDLGIEINESILNVLKGFIEILQANEPELRKVALVIGDLITSFGQPLGEGFLGVFESLVEAAPQAVLGLVDLVNGVDGLITGIRNLISPVKDFAQIWISLLEFSLAPLTLIDDAIKALGGTVDEAGDGVLTFSDIWDFWKEGAINSIAGVTGALAGLNNLLQGFDIAAILKGDLNINNLLKESASVAITSGAEVLKSYDALADRQNTRIKNAEDILNAEQKLGDGDFELPSRDTETELTDEEKKRLDELESISKKRLDIELDTIRKILDAEEKLSQDRSDLLLDYLQELEDASIKFNRKEEDRETDLARKLRDLDLKAKNAKIDSEKDRTRKLLDIEEDYLRRLRDLRAKFEFDALELIRSNDAVGFLRRKRQFDFDRAQLKIKTQDERDDARDDFNKKDADNDAQRKREREKILRDNADKKADNKLALDRELEDLKLANERKLAELELAFERENEKIQKDYERKLEDFNVFALEEEGLVADSLDAQLELIDQGNEAIQNKESEFYTSRLQALSAFNEEYENEYRALLEKQQSLASDLDTGLGSDVGVSSAEATGGLTGGRDMGGDIPYLNELYRIATELATEIPPSQIENRREILNNISRARGDRDISALRRIIISLGGDLPPPSRGRQFGGGVQKGLSYLVGESGPELFMSNTSGRVLNNNQIGSLPSPQTTSIDNSRTFNADNLNLGGSDLTPATIAMMSEVAKQVVMQMMGGA